MVQQTEYLKLRKLDPVGRHTCWGGRGELNERGVYFYTIFGKLEFKCKYLASGHLYKGSALETIHSAGLDLILNIKSVVLQ